MAHIFDVMAIINGQLNILSKHYDGSGNNIMGLPTIPSFLIVSVNRAVDTQPQVVEDAAKPPIIDMVIKADAGDNFNPVYICVAENIKTPVVDKVPVMVNHKNDFGPGIGYVVIVPMRIFDQDTPIEEVSVLLKDLYFRVLDLDVNMTYKAEPAIIRLSESSKIRIFTYDITMIYAALGCVNINLRSWYASSTGAPLKASYTVNAFTDEELPPKYKVKVEETLNKNATKIGNLRDSVGNGNLIRNALYEN